MYRNFICTDDHGIFGTISRISNKVCCDNVVAIYLASNEKISRITKDIDTRTHFARRYVEDGMIKIIFVWSDENDADILTKNTSESTYKKHIVKFMIQNST